MSSIWYRKTRCICIKILPNGSASRTNLRIGDRILKVNNCDVSQATHLEAVQALLQPTNEVILLVRHEPQPAGLKEIILTRHSGEPLGIRINGGVDGKRVNPDDPEDDGIFVTEVKDGSPASGILTVGTRILEVNNQSLFGARLDDAQKWLSIPSETIHLLTCYGFKLKETTSVTSPTKSLKQIDNTRSILTQQSSSPIPPARHNGVSLPHNISHSPKVTSPAYTNTPNQQLSPQPPPVPTKPKYRSPHTQFVPINGDNHTSKPQAQNGLEIDESDLSVTESEISFKDKKKFFESGFKASGPKPKPRQFKYINEHELLQMKQEDEQKVKTMSPTELLQSRTMYDKDTELMQTTLSQYQTPTYLAEPEDDQTEDDILSPTARVNSHDRETASAHTMLSKFAIADSGMA